MRKGATEPELMEAICLGRDARRWRLRTLGAAPGHRRPGSQPAARLNRTFCFMIARDRPAGDVTRVDRRYALGAPVLEIVFETRDGAVRIMCGPRPDRTDSATPVVEARPRWPRAAKHRRPLHLAAMDPLSESCVVSRRGCRGADSRAARSITAVWTARERSRPVRMRVGFAGLLPS